MDKSELEKMIQKTPELGRVCCDDYEKCTLPCVPRFEWCVQQSKEFIIENMNPTHDPVNHPTHYTSHPSGIECIQVTEHMGFNLGNAVKYIWRADLKTDAIEDLKKARWYIDRELMKRGVES